MIGKGNTVYYIHINSATCTHRLRELHIRTVYEDRFVGTDIEDGVAYILDNYEYGKTVFDSKELAMKKGEENGES